MGTIIAFLLSALGLPLLYGAMGFLVWRASKASALVLHSQSEADKLNIERRAWIWAQRAGGWGLALTLATLLANLIAAMFFSYEVDRLGLTAALLVALLGWVIINYSQHYLQGEARQLRFILAMLFTLFCTSTLVLSQHLLVIVLAWSGTAFGLHHLLTFYPDRKAAQIVAHKKMLVSRLAELCLLVALLLIYTQTGSLHLEDINTFIRQQDDSGTGTLAFSLHLAMVFVALAAILKTAQLPLHGWLIQVMEAPTPVSALLHAGVVNMGGFVLIRLAELLALSTFAQALLVIIGSLTAVLSALVMLTRISIKVRLAWSTCAQMGFMLMEIGLGLYELALLHLMAHSLYKAHAFLSAGDVVAEASWHDFIGKQQQKPAPLWYASAFVVSIGTVLLSLALWQIVLPDLHLSIAATLIVSLGLAPLLWLELGSTVQHWFQGLLRVAALTQLYLFWHMIFAELAPVNAQAPWPLLFWVMFSFIGLYTLQVWLRLYPQGQLARRLFPWAYCGFYLDETFTRLTFKYWPAELTSTQAQTLFHRFQQRKSGGKA